MIERDFKRVFLPDDRQLNGKASQTFLRHFNVCPRSAFLYQTYKGEAKTPAMVRGSALHTAAERMNNATIAADEPMCPPDLVKSIAEEVLFEEHVPIEEHDYIREMAYRLGDEWTLEPETVIAVETLFVLEVAGFQVRCKIDFAALFDDGRRAEVADYKTARAAVPYEEISRKRSDGTFAAKGFQLILYALAIVYGVPVREEMHLGERVEVLEPFPVAATAQEVFIEFVYPGLAPNDGPMLRRGVSLRRSELEVYRQSLEALLQRLAASIAEGDWPAIVSDAACSECPAAALCPIPVELRDHRGEINSVEQASEALEKVERVKAESAAIRREVKNFAKDRGVEIRFGRDKVARFVTREVEKVVDRDGMFEAVERTAEYGEPFERSRFVQTVTSSSFEDVKLTEDDLAAEAAEKEVSDG